MNSRNPNKVNRSAVATVDIDHAGGLMAGLLWLLPWLIIGFGQ